MRAPLVRGPLLRTLLAAAAALALALPAFASEGAAKLDRSKVKSIRYRPSWHKYVYAVFVVFFLALGYLGAQPPSELGNYVSQLGTLIYFGFFLLMPWWSQLGEFKPVPDRVVYHAH